MTERDLELIVLGRHGDPHRVLGLHEGVVRAFRPDAQKMHLLVDSDPGATVDMKMIHPAGVFEGRIDSDDDRPQYQLEALYSIGGQEVSYRYADPYRCWPTLGDVDLHLFGEGRHMRLWEILGAHHRVHDGAEGTAFAVWAPNARAVRVVGDWNLWDGRVHPMRSLGASGVWELFIPGVEPGARYKYELVAADGRLILKSDPMAASMERPPATASIVVERDRYTWGDSDWLERRAGADLLHEPVSIYEMHLGSWRYTDDGEGGRRPLSYRELAEQLPAHLTDLGFTHVEFMPVAEHPFSGSWGYQVSGYYAPTSRFGPPDDFRLLVDALHQAGIGVIVDWVPAHFPKDEFALARFDGTALYEHSDPRQGEHQDWGTLIFNFGRNEVRNFLLANALYWVEKFHIDGLRVDAVASMLYLDYSREPGQWVPNQFGGRENLDAVAFLKEVNEAVFGLYPGATVMAEESTAWPGVSRPTYLGGLGFGFKWNMGWMHDTLDYFSHDPIHRRYHHGELTFGLIYAWSENFVLPLSHDEVVHGKGSLLNKMPGDRWQQLANLRALYSWMWAHPGKQLLFMGAELAPEGEWNYERELDWWILDQWDSHRGVRDLLRSLNQAYTALPALWERDATHDGFQWIDADDSDQSVISFLRLPADGDPGRSVVCVANLTPVPRYGYRVGFPVGGRWQEVLNSDAGDFGGSGVGNCGSVEASGPAWHGRPHSAELTLPPLGVLWLTPG
ncbi:MAG TPA: 1,4-alpha-glucan branching protein GlgB [Acidimicrobiales bacterium]|nr:1,4-alpha-glucan branching protein GlgB [Acidimicrobiales bacterium]